MVNRKQRGRGVVLAKIEKNDRAPQESRVGVEKAPFPPWGCPCAWGDLAQNFLKFGDVCPK